MFHLSKCCKIFRYYVSQTFIQKMDAIEMFSLLNFQLKQMQFKEVKQHYDI